VARRAEESIRVTTEPTLRLVVHLVDLPPRACVEKTEVEAGIGRGDEALPGVKEAGGLRFAAEVRVGRRAGAPNFLGPFAFGTPTARFLYLVWSGVSAGRRERFRRLKIKLDMPAALVDEALAKDAPLHVTVGGTAKDGGPACATPPPLRGWSFEGK